MNLPEKRKIKDDLENKEHNKDKILAQKKDSSLDPTRYGDWEKKGRAIDF